MAGEQRVRKVTVRYTLEEYQRLDKKFRQTTSRQLSHYIRAVTLAKPVVVKYRNASMDSMMEELIVLRQELKAIGNNYNQAVRKLHSLKFIPEFRQWMAANEAMQEQFINKTNLIAEQIEKLGDKW